MNQQELAESIIRNAAKRTACPFMQNA